MVPEDKRTFLRDGGTLPSKQPFVMKNVRKPWAGQENHLRVLAVAVSCCIMFQCFNDVRNLLKPSGYGSKYEPTKKRMVQKMQPKVNNPSLRLANTFKYPIFGTQQYVPRLHSQNSWPSLVKICSAWGVFFG